MLLTVSAIVGLHSGQCFLMLHTSMLVGVSRMELNVSGKGDGSVAKRDSGSNWDSPTKLGMVGRRGVCE